MAGAAKAKAAKPPIIVVDSSRLRVLWVLKGRLLMFDITRFRGYRGLGLEYSLLPRQIPPSQLPDVRLRVVQFASLITLL
jgi:hypothetical protein